MFPKGYTIISISNYEYRRAVVRKYKIIYFIRDGLVIIARIYAPGQLVAENND